MDKLLRLSETRDISIFLTNFKERYIIIQMMVVFRENGDFEFESCMSSSCGEQKQTTSTPSGIPWVLMANDPIDVINKN